MWGWLGVFGERAARVSVVNIRILKMRCLYINKFVSAPAAKSRLPKVNLDRYAGSTFLRDYFEPGKIDAFDKVVEEWKNAAMTAEVNEWYSSNNKTLVKYVSDRLRCGKELYILSSLPAAALAIIVERREVRRTEKVDRSNISLAKFRKEFPSLMLFPG